MHVGQQEAADPVSSRLSPPKIMRSWILLTLMLSMCFAGQCSAQLNSKHERETPQQERSASDARSFLELFTKLERDWIQAEQRRDGAALDAMLAPEFTLRSSESPEHPVPRAEWIQRALSSYDIHSYSHRAIVIRAFLGAAVVSFVQSQKATLDGKDCSGDYLIVDLWETNHDKWQLSSRFMAPAFKHSTDSTKSQK